MAFSLVRSLVKHTLKHVADGLTGGLIPIGSIAADVFEEWSKKDKPASPLERRNHWHVQAQRQFH